jgi:chromosome segregation ATPase
MSLDNTMKKAMLFAVLLVSATSLSAAPRDAAGGSAKMVGKLQAMVKEATTERDLLKTENAKVSAELETLKGQLKQNEQDKELAKAAEAKLSADLASQKTASDEVHKRLDNTTAKLREVIEKYNALNKAKTDLEASYAALQNNQQATSSELKSCEAKNLKMFEGAKAVMDGYQSCQQRGVMDTLIGSEPFSQVKNVEFETAMQEYEDKLRKQKYQSNPVPQAAPAPAKP